MCQKPLRCSRGRDRARDSIWNRRAHRLEGQLDLAVMIDLAKIQELQDLDRVSKALFMERSASTRLTNEVQVAHRVLTRRRRNGQPGDPAIAVAFELKAYRGFAIRTEAAQKLVRRNSAKRQISLTAPSEYEARTARLELPAGIEVGTEPGAGVLCHRRS